MKTKLKQLDGHQWHIFDASGRAMGRLASEIVKFLIGKHKVDYIPNIDRGDHVVVTNIGKIKLSGNKILNKKYYSHSQHLGNLKTKKIIDIGTVNAFFHSVKGMLPKNKLQQIRLKRLHLYENEDYPHKANISE